MQTQRDGKLQSIWQQNIEVYQPQNSWSRDTRYDALIVGGGITGLTTALMLQEKGLKCILAEAHNIGFGTTGGTTAHLNTLLDAPYSDIESDFSAEASRVIRKASRDAISTIEKNVQRFGIGCDFEYQDGFLIAQDEKEVKQLDEIVAGAQRAGDDAQFVEGVSLPMPAIKVALFARQARFHPLKYLVGLAKAFEAAGGVLLQHCVVSSVNQEAEFEALTSLGMIRAHQVVYATHIPPGINLLHFRCAPYRSYAIAFQPRSGNSLPGFVYDLKDPYNYFRTHLIDGQEYVIAGGFDHKTGHEANTENCFRELEVLAGKMFDMGQVAFRWSSQYFQSADGLPYIGKLPGSDLGLWVATGFGGNGLIFGTLSGMMLSEMLTGGDHSCTEILRPGRIKPIAGFANFVKENADVVGRLMGRKINYEQLKNVTDLAPGQAMLANWDGDKVAIFKDGNGACHGVNPVCVHAGCTVSWNTAEESWDCPCHGARYSPKGDMLNGPAQSNLQQLIIEKMDGD
jgi:glycine/D-amino acid oxidase-like deaminating enzyme/nitrite reductase/ring-hydroxylating ferredoxin subunit